MKIPALRAKMGDRVYYVTTLSFDQVDKFVSRVDDELHQSDSLKELIQRSITDNFISIKEYVLNQPELFFNALVLAVYDDFPNWREIEFQFEDMVTYNMGLLEFPGSHKIFPVDGQHRVEGIKSALAENPELGSQKITAIFIGHKNDETGMQRTRRLFSTLNRYAKPVSMDDIIALDEDDSIAIATRELLELFELFSDNRVTKSKNKAIPETDKHSLTSIITLYQCNRELLKLFRRVRKRNSPNTERDKKSLDKYLKFRPSQEEVDLFTNYCFDFWNVFQENIDEINEFISEENQRSDQPALPFRNKEFGGNLLFRPVGLLPTVQAAIEIQKRTERSFPDIFTQFNKIDMNLNAKPWRNVLWNPNEQTMIMGTSGIVKLILIYMMGEAIIRASELHNLKAKYADRINSDNLDSVLDEIPLINNQE